MMSVIATYQHTASQPSSFSESFFNSNVLFFKELDAATTNENNKVFAIFPENVSAEL